MAKPLQKGLFTVLLFLAIFSSSLAPGVFAQVAIENRSGVEISFSEETSLSQSGFIQFTPNDISQIILGGNSSEIRSWDAGRTELSPFYVLSESGELGVGGLKPENSPMNRLFYLLVENSMPDAIQSFQVVFDLLYQTDFSDEYVLQLRYSINGEEWRDVTGARVDQRMLRNNGEEWNTFSIQTTLNDLLLDNSESIEFEWVNLNGDVATDEIPIAVQSMEFVPEFFTPQEFKRGEIIISEILPATEGENGSLEFVELYNPTEHPISLKGLEIRTPAGSQIIRRDLFILPREFTVLSHGYLPESDRPENLYEYQSSILSSNSGYVEIYNGDSELAKATYERSDQGKSLEINTIANGFDGYTSLQHFQPSSANINGQLSATPGKAGSTQRMFLKELEENGWHLLSAPGLLDERLSRLNDRNIRIPGTDNQSLSELNPGAPFFLKTEDRSSKKIYAAESVQEYTPQSMAIEGTSSKIITLGSDKNRQVSELGDLAGRRISPAYLQWDSKDQSFELLFEPESVVSAWSPLIVHEDASSPAGEVSSTPSGNNLNRLIQFQLFENRQGSQRKSLDQSILGFLREERGASDLRYDLPKLLPVTEEEFLPEDLNLLYLNTSESGNRANSFTHLPLEPSEAYTINVGVVSSSRSYQAVLDWSDMRDIPEEWILTLTDNVNGREIDMREQTSYEFRMSSSEQDFEQMEQKPGTINPYSPDNEEERFTVTVEPYESAITENSDVNQPGNVELRQNYPNPFNPSTNVVFYLPEQQPVKVGVYNIVGQQVALLADENYGPGEHSISWDASEMPSGVYIVQLEVGSQIFTRKITLIK